MWLQSLFGFVGLVLGVLAGGHALLYKRRPQSAFAWIAVCLAVPYAGALFYCLFGINRVRTRAKKLRSWQAQRLAQPAASARPPAGLEALGTLGFAVSGMPLVGGNAVEVLHNGEQTFPAMLEAIGRASRSVYLSTYIFDDDSVGREFTAALRAAKDRGADVRVLLDGIGILYSWPPVQWRLRKAGIRCSVFLPPRLWPPSFHVNLRNHRKVMIVDGEIGFVGGMNVSARHLVEADNTARVVDMHFRCSGPVVTQLRSVFSLDWQFVTGESLPTTDDRDVVDGGALCRAVADGPDEDVARLTELLVGAVGTATRRVAIMTPYFLPPREVTATLRAAALRGVEVAVILPGRNNLPYVHRATRHMLWELLQRGVQVYYQPPPFVHSKLLVIDDDYSLIGSANWDARSLRLNFELNVEVYDRGFTAALYRHFESVRARSTAVTLEEVDRRPLLTRVLDGAAWLFSPYL